MTPIPIQPIGVVRSPLKDVLGHPDYHAVNTIEIYEPYLDGLKGIEAFSHFHVIYHQNCVDEWKQKRNWPKEGEWIVPPPDPRAGQGVFTIRAPCRPAQLGSCIVRLIRREGTVLTVDGLDAIDGSPVFDLKIYMPSFDAISEASTPSNWTPGMPQRYEKHPD